MKIRVNAIILGFFSLFLTSVGYADEWIMLDRYQVKGELVKDPITGLMWMRCSFGQNWNGSTCAGSPAAFTWDQAMNASKHFEHAGYNDWRIPTREELKTLVYCSSGQTKTYDEGASSCAGSYIEPSIVKAVFPEASTVFWSSSSYANVSGHAWSIYFGSGYDGWHDKSSIYQVRLVRIAQ